ncbi:MAG: PBP1A family penicillin-binding protein [Acidobacteria bacterium]|nr:PBP1A family penicillin-binding protein [Acidobacteriota bacterium]
MYNKKVISVLIPQPKRKLRFLPWMTYSLLLLCAAMAGTAAGLIFGYGFDLEQVEELQTVRPNIVSYVYSDKGTVLGQFALERRILVSYDEIPKNIKNAILATEDQNFFRHTGIDFRRLASTVLRDLLFWEQKGASTLTMQLSKLRFTSPEKTLERKIKDMLFAIQIEKNYSKEQIFTFYCNQIYLGHGNYGIASAADYYFGKRLNDLTLAESALLAGIIFSPQNFSPITHPDRAVSRRNYVLRRMYEEAYIDRATLKSTIAEPLNLSDVHHDQGSASYFVEWVRQYLENKYQTGDIWQGGLRIYTTIDYDVQTAAYRALREGLKKFDKASRRWSGPEENILESGGDLRTYTHPEWGRTFYEGQMVRGLVLESNAAHARVKVGSYNATLGPKEISWTHQTRVDRILKEGDVAVFSVTRINHADRTLEVLLDRVPEVQGAILALENKTGALKAMVGGFDFRQSKFNRATQALRQPGSIFKPFTYVAAMEAGYSPLDTVLDAPISFPGLTGVYAPTNSDGEFRGLIPIRQALAQSRNVPTIRIANAIGIEKVIQAAQRFGLERDFPPYLPIALGAGETTLQEIVSAFSVFPNNGVRALPYFIQRIENYNGVATEEHRHQFKEVISTETSAKMIYLLRAVVEAGTATAAKTLQRPLGGKTGTTDDATDSWFVGFTPSLTAGVWVGYDEKKSLGERVFGATLALPIWINFMGEALKGIPVEEFESSFAPEPASPNVTAVAFQEDSKTGQAEPISVEDITPPARR